MKKSLSLILLCATLVLLPACITSQACKDAPDSIACKEANAARIGRVLENLAYTGTFLALDKNPQWSDQFKKVSEKLFFISAQPSIDLLTLRTALADLPIKEMKSAEAMLIIGNVQIILDEVGYGVLDLTDAVYFRSVATGLAKGIQRGLGEQ